MNSTDAEMITEYGTVGDCLLCGDDLERGQIRVRIEYPSQVGWAHEECADRAEQDERASAAAA